MAQAIGPPGPAPARPPRRRRAGKRRHVWRLLAVICAAPLVFAIVAATLLIGQEITAPSWLRDRVEAQAGAFLDGGTISFGAIMVQLGTDLHPRVRLTHTELRDAEGALIARIPEVAAVVSPRGILFRREVLPQDITLVGAELYLRRDIEGAVALSFGPGQAAVGRAEGFLELFDGLDTALERTALEALEHVGAEGLIVNYDDARAGRGWTVDGGRLDLTLGRQTTSLRGEVTLLSGRAYVTSLVLSYESPRGSRAAAINLALTDVASEDIASQSAALSWLGVMQAPLSANLRAKIDDNGALGPLSARLEIGQGVVQPVPEVRPIAFTSARTYLTYSPSQSTMFFDDVSVQTDWGSFAASGKATLSDFRNGLPGAMIGQLALSDIVLDPEGIYPEPIRFNDAAADMRLHLAPFRLELGEASIDIGGERLRVSGQVEAAASGWAYGLDARLRRVDQARLMSYWPGFLRPITREWFTSNLTSGILSNIAGSVRSRPGEPVDYATSFEFADVTARFMRALPPVQDGTGVATLANNRFTLALDQGQIAAPQGGLVEAGGSVFTIPDITLRETPASVRLRTDSTITAALALLDMPPFEFLTKASLPVALADGRASTQGGISLALKPVLGPGEVQFDMTARLSGVRSEVLVPGRVLTATALEVTADPAGMTIRGPIRVGEVPAEAVLTRSFGTGPQAPTRIEGTVELSQRFIDEFGIGLPDDMVSGAGRGEVQIDLVAGVPPHVRLTSDLVGLGLSLPAVNWRKPAQREGALVAEGSLGDLPVIDRLDLDAAGLRAEGSVTLRPEGGGLDRASFGSVRLGGWLNAPVDLVGRGPGRTVGIEIRGGALDLRQANFGSSGSGGGPITVSLDRLQVTEGIALRQFRGEFDAAGGFSGRFSGRINDGGPVQGTVVPQGGRSAVRILSDDAGAVLAGADMLETAIGGSMDMSLVPTGATGNYDGLLKITDIRLRDAPALASLLDAVSIVGLLQQLDGQGLSFSDVDAEFRITPDQIIVTRSSAIGAGLGISLDGIYTIATKAMDFQGVISPFYLLNGIGAVFTRPGEGLIGFNFTLTGPVGTPVVSVNPLSVLTPGMFREIFRRAPPVVSE